MFVLKMVYTILTQLMRKYDSARVVLFLGMTMTYF